jgi:hypothetical protein
MTTATAPDCPVGESFDPLSPEFLADPYAVMAKRPHMETPVFFAPSIGYYVVTRHADIEAVFRDPATYSAAVAQAPLVPLVPEAQQILLAGGHRVPGRAELGPPRARGPGGDRHQHGRVPQVHPRPGRRQGTRAW